MKSFHVIAGWLTPEERIGTCYVDRARGNEIISFSYDSGWLSAHTGIVLDPDLLPVEGRQYPPENKPCFGFLADAAPDRWGRRLMDRRERIDADNEKCPVKKLLQSDYILGVNDAGRQGALRFFDSESDQYLSTRDIFAAPPIAGIRELEQASLHLEKSSGTEAAKWLRNLIDPGSSLGGARPKANVTNEKGNILIAKFPLHHDSINVGAWEMNAALYFRIRKDDAKDHAGQIISLVRDNWESIAQKYHIAKQERMIMREAFASELF